MTVNGVKQQAKIAECIKVEHKPGTGYTVLTGITLEGAFYDAFGARTFNALKRHGIIVLDEDESMDGHEVYGFNFYKV